MSLLGKVCEPYPDQVLFSTSFVAGAHLKVCYLAVEELGYTGVQVGRELNISGKGVSKCMERGKKIIDNTGIAGDYLL